MRLPGLTVENEPGADIPGQAQEAPEVILQGLAPARVCKQDMTGEMRDRDAVVEDQVRFETGIGQEDLLRKLR